MKKKIALITLTVAVIILMLFPGVAMNFSNSYGDTIMKYYSYFNPMPIGYGNWFPILTAIFSIIVLILHIKSIKRGALIWQSICVVASLMAWVPLVSANGLLNVTVFGVMISVVHIVAVIFQIIFYKFGTEVKR